MHSIHIHIWNFPYVIFNSLVSISRSPFSSCVKLRWQSNRPCLSTCEKEYLSLTPGFFSTETFQWIISHFILSISYFAVVFFGISTTRFEITAYLYPVSRFIKGWKGFCTYILQAGYHKFRLFAKRYCPVKGIVDDSTDKDLQKKRQWWIWKGFKVFLIHCMPYQYPSVFSYRLSSDYGHNWSGNSSRQAFHRFRYSSQNPGLVSYFNEIARNAHCDNFLVSAMHPIKLCSAIGLWITGNCS